MDVTIGREQLRAFEILSHDRNPLHNDPAYSRSTQFGCTVVYGICGVLFGLGIWAEGRPFRLTRIQGRFTQPLFESEEYQMEIRERGNEVEIRYLKGEAIRLNFGFAWEIHQAAEQNNEPEHPWFQPLDSAVHRDLKTAPIQWQGANYPYCVRLEDLSRLLPDLYLRPGQMPMNQLNALMGSSYLVGMEIPGRQALYSTFEFEFEPEPAEEDKAEFQFSNVSAEWDERFNRVALSGRGAGIQTFSLSAYQRPDRITYGIDEVQLATGCSNTLRDKIVLISGATRGFGNVLTKMFALHGATVFANCRSSRNEIDATASEVRRWNNNVFTVPGDVSKTEDCRRIRAEIDDRVGRIDILVSNAFPQIPAAGFMEQSSSEFLRFVNESVSTTVTLLRELLPLISDGGIVVLVSTRYTCEPQKQYSHYIASKSCLEGLVRVLALEFPSQKFVIARPPRMLTDQTNLPFDLSPPVSAVDVARELMEAIRQLHSTSNLIELNLGKN